MVRCGTGRLGSHSGSRAGPTKPSSPPRPRASCRAQPARWLGRRSGRSGRCDRRPASDRVRPGRSARGGSHAPPPGPRRRRSRDTALTRSSRSAWSMRMRRSQASNARQFSGRSACSDSDAWRTACSGSTLSANSRRRGGECASGSKKAGGNSEAASTSPCGAVMIWAAGLWSRRVALRSVIAAAVTRSVLVSTRQSARAICLRVSAWRASCVGGEQRVHRADDGLEAEDAGHAPGCAGWPGRSAPGRTGRRVR